MGPEHGGQTENMRGAIVPPTIKVSKACSTSFECRATRCACRTTQFGRWITVVHLFCQEPRFFLVWQTDADVNRLYRSSCFPSRKS